MEEYPEKLKDQLEAYPLRLDVAALPDRRFFKMTRTLTIMVALAGALLIVLATFLNYQINHLDISVRKGSTWQFFQINPEENRLQPMQSSKMGFSSLQFAVEQQLTKYLTLRNSTVWDTDTMNRNFGNLGLITQMTNPTISPIFDRESKSLLARTRSEGLIRDVHIYDLRLLGGNLWMAIIETFDLPITDDLTSECLCSDNSPACLSCKTKKAKYHERRKIWIRTSYQRPKTLENPLGVSVDKYISTILPIHPEETYWGLPSALRPEI